VLTTGRSHLLRVTTHNHFVLDRDGKTFKQTAPVVKLAEASNEDDHLCLLAVLNSSIVCFWLKQATHNKGSTLDSNGARQSTVPWEDFYQFNSTKSASCRCQPSCRTDSGALSMDWRRE